MDSPTAAGSRTQVAVLALVGATVVWGSTFLVTKQSLPGTTPASFLVWRFGIAAVVLALARPSRLVALTAPERRHGVVLGFFVACGFLLQTTGLQDTAAGVSGFLTGTAVMLTPLVAATWFGERVGRAGWAAVGLSTVGVGLLMLRSTTLTTGAVLTLAGAACFAVHIAALSRWASPGNAYGLTAWTVGVATILSGAAAAAQGGLAAPPSGAAWRAVVYLACAATCAGFLVQAWAQSILTATTAAVVMTLEPLVAAAVSGESLGLRAGSAAAAWSPRCSSPSSVRAGAATRCLPGSSVAEPATVLTRILAQRIRPPVSGGRRMV